jgi:hypothetical protein
MAGLLGIFENGLGFLFVGEGLGSRASSLLQGLVVGTGIDGGNYGDIYLPM